MRIWEAEARDLLVAGKRYRCEVECCNCDHWVVQGSLRRRVLEQEQVLGLLAQSQVGEVMAAQLRQLACQFPLPHQLSALRLARRWKP
jgi:hypothetical protein